MKGENFQYSACKKRPTYYCMYIFNMPKKKKKHHKTQEKTELWKDNDMMGNDSMWSFGVGCLKRSRGTCGRYELNRLLNIPSHTTLFTQNPSFLGSASANLTGLVSQLHFLTNLLGNPLQSFSISTHSTPLHMNFTCFNSFLYLYHALGRRLQR